MNVDKRPFNGLFSFMPIIIIDVDFYLNLIQVDKNKKLAKEFVKRVAIANGELKDKEVRFLVRMKHAWGYEHFD